MARKRTLDPGIWTSEQFLNCSIRQRLIFIGLISNADDEGRLRGEAKRIKALIFPGDHIPLSQIENDLQFLTLTRLIHRWQIDNEIFIELPSWKKYQKFNYKTDSHLPFFLRGTNEELTKDLVSSSPQVRELSKSIKQEEKISCPGIEEPIPGRDLSPDSQKKTKAKYLEVDLGLARYLCDKIKSNCEKEKVLESKINKWAEIARLMREVDGRSQQEIEALIDFVHGNKELEIPRDEFWYINIRSMRSFREHFSQLWERMKQAGIKEMTKGEK